MKMNICVLNASYEKSNSSFRGYDPYGSPARFAPEHQWQHHLIEKATAVRQVRALAQRGVDVFVNLCDGAWDEDRAGLDVVLTLERCGAAFTGADSSFYEPTRETMKRVCHVWGVRTPGWQFAKDRRDAERAAETLRWPMIVKHPNSYSSVGMGRDAKVTHRADLVARVERMVATFGEALIEEFIEGREFTVLLAEASSQGGEPLALPPVEFHFPQGETFKHFELKWSSFAGMSCSRVGDDALERELVKASRALFLGLRGSGYARCDLRVDGAGQVFALELNPNCSIFYPEGQYGSADSLLALQPHGHRDFLDHILQCALRRQQRQRRPFEIRYDARWGYGMIASRCLSPGELIDVHEERPHHLVTRAHVERCWNERQRAWFYAYAWPLTDELFVSWSDDPEQWRPVNHSCDPNAWLQGLDVVARRSIGEGEPITLDYATFCGPTMAPFACACGTARCRGQIRPEDHLAPWLSEQYGDHISDYVQRARMRMRTTP